MYGIVISCIKFNENRIWTKTVMKIMETRNKDISVPGISRVLVVFSTSTRKYQELR